MSMFMRTLQRQAFRRGRSLRLQSHSFPAGPPTSWVTQVGRGTALVGLSAAAACGFSETSSCDSSGWTEHRDVSGKNYYYIPPEDLDLARVHAEVDRKQNELRESLQGLGATKLAKRARETGADEAAVTEARNSGKGRIEALVDLIIKNQKDKLQRDAEDMVRRQMESEKLQREAAAAREKARFEREHAKKIEVERKEKQRLQAELREKQRKADEQAERKRRRAAEAAATENARLEELELRTKLAAMSISQLTDIAREYGGSEAKIECAEDKGDEALHDLIVSLKKKAAAAQPDSSWILGAGDVATAIVGGVLAAYVLTKAGEQEQEGRAEREEAN